MKQSQSGILPPNTFGERLRSERKRLGLSQSALAEKAELTKGTVIRYEQGHSYPDARTLATWGKAGVDLSFLFRAFNVEFDFDNLDHTGD